MVFREIIELTTLSSPKVKLPCHLNLAQCYIKSGKFKKAREQCDKALDIDAKNIKVGFIMKFSLSLPLAFVC